ncbi:uncharacterized protein LOC132706761 isoform X2 [Cylas formicarius]|uniref:uncharacterized protein LOC132706761 isoform X2 n=1 Tax=Cylas formicarius TaxID=197179 RepID=UPI00295895B1|nr:uncharacterized protein LOC132706761 isoform X2 [Cylas formicarius]XP_060534258.1 uncharacterized protein LOC132706761 isoform X2 [Cylas formicarius]XP_060534259.1 uncharacterized protein LOC132706761 isoform X2 [Cylas formicarius]
MKPKKHRTNGPTRQATVFGRMVAQYEPSFKKAVILYAEQKSTSEAKKRYGISESNIRRWRRLKAQILEKASQAVRRSARVTTHKANDFCEDDSLDNSNNSLDSMPLQQRLSQSAQPDPQPGASQQQEPVLQSQPLSPTKLKVTRQAAKPQLPLPKITSPQPPNEEVCLRWNSHHTNMQAAFPSLLLKEQYVDATLVAEGKTLKCHRMILSSCSPYFEEVLSGISPIQHPVLFMKDIPFWILKALCDFMYAGEVHIFQNRLEELLKVAEALKIKGLAGRPHTKDDPNPSPIVATVKEEKDPMTQPAVLKQKDLKEPKDEKEKKREDKKVKLYNLTKAELPKLSPKPSTSRSPAKSSYPHSPKKFDRNKSSQHSDILKEKEKTPLKKGDMIDPLDLLEPVYEEITKEPPPLLKPAIPLKLREVKHVPIKRNIGKKVKKRRYVEDREESPPLMFQSRKGTRSRPNVKVPKFFHSHYEPQAKETGDAPIVREPHTVQNDPLIQVEDIKAEPLDVEDTIIDVSDNMVSFDDQEMTSHEEEIIGNYDSPIVNMKGCDTPTPFAKIKLLPQPVIMDVHTVTENVQEKLLLACNKDSVKLVDISKLGTINTRHEDPLDGSNILISNVQSVVEDIAEVETSEPLKISSNELVHNTESNAKSNGLSFRIESVVSECTNELSPSSSQETEVSKEIKEMEKELPQLGGAEQLRDDDVGDMIQLEAPGREEETPTTVEDAGGLMIEAISENSISQGDTNDDEDAKEPEGEEKSAVSDESVLEGFGEDDVVMKGGNSDKGTEKTLEMIVNDLNESLGEMMMKETDSCVSETS